MTRLQRNISMKNRNARWKEIAGTIKGFRGYVLHHKDVNMMRDNIERYILWLPDDLMIMTKADHLRLHHTGTKMSDETKLKMRLAKLGKPKTMEQRRKMSESHKRFWFNKKSTPVEIQA